MKQTASLVTCQGRRRIGKSTLFERFAELNGCRFLKIEGLAPRSEQIIEGVMQVQALAESESIRRRDMPEYQKLLDSYNISN